MISDLVDYIRCAVTTVVLFALALIPSWAYIFKYRLISIDGPVQSVLYWVGFFILLLIQLALLKAWLVSLIGIWSD